MSTSREVTSARLRARQIIYELKIRSPDELSIEDIAWVRGAFVREGRLEGADGRLARGSRRGTILVRWDIREPGRKRLVIAHELGHFELHRDTDQAALCAEEDFHHWYKRRPEELEATEFAAELLMPDTLFRPRSEVLMPSFEAIEVLAREFETSLTATAVRYIECSPHRCALVVSTQGKVKWLVRSEDFRYWIPPGAALSKNTYAADFLGGDNLPTGMQTVPVSAWIQEGHFDSTAVIKEESRALPRYNTVLSLLWIDQDFDESDEEDDSDVDLDHFTPDGKRWRW